MPTYDYRCEKCGDTFEHFQKMSSEPLTTCAKCGGHLIRLLGGGAGLIFKGSGFYCTDYHSKQNQTGGAETKQSDGKAPAPAKPSASNTAS